ncbi:MAG: right-handed parallel beta-helix repeat-containing protein, partial [Kosmotogaceae bacterium]
MKAFCKIRSFRFARFASLSLIVLISSFLFAGQLDLPVDGYRPPTEVAGVISEDTVWTKAGSPYIVRSTVTISVDAVLNVEPGAEIYFVQNQELIVRGMLRAVGSQDAPIIFRGTVEIPGWWRAIHIQNEGSAILEWCEISFGGATHGAGVLKTGSGGLRLANSTIRRTNGDGLRVAAGYSFFESLGNRFLYNNNGVR